MKYWIILALTMVMSTAARADLSVATFEDVGLTTPNSYFNATPNGTDPNTVSSGQFVSGGSSFNNSYDPNQGWFGWSISNQTYSSQSPYMNQTTTPDYNYLYMAVTGSGAGLAGAASSPTYAVANTLAFPSDNPNVVHPAASIINLAANTTPSSVQITNTEYDYLSMTYGDGIGKKFGPTDFLELTIQGYSGQNGTGSAIGKELDFYLAQNGTIVTDWETLNLSQFAGAQSLVFGLESSDNDPTYGMNTPAEFALDNFTVLTPGSVPEPSSLGLCLSGIGIGTLMVRRVRARKGTL